jgi:hypothetical protein
MYIPSAQELFVTAGLTALGFMAFGLIAKYFNVFTHVTEHQPEEKSAPAVGAAALPVTVE